MLLYLIKLTSVWLVLLIAFELLFKKASYFRANRVYLFLAILAGIVMPLLPLKLSSQASTVNNTVNLNKNFQRIDVYSNAISSSPAMEKTLSWSQVFYVIYFIGAMIMFIITLKEIILILRKAVYGNYITVQNHKIFSSSKLHAPFSFMGWVFMSNPSNYKEDELAFILKHEDAHNQSYHWLDMILIQMVFIVFWFHPLVWRFRYLLKMNHEFEADQKAASGNAYEYGHFLLEQTLLQGTPVIAHSFHFSPVKTRISMLTQTRKTSKWKYALALPILMGYTVLFAKSIPDNQRVRVGDVTTFKGHQFYWTKPSVDTIMITDRESGHIKPIAMRNSGYPFKMDNDSLLVFKQTIENYQTPKFRNEAQDISEYLTEKFKEKIKDPLDTISQIAIYNVIVDAKGKIRYYEVGYRGRHFSDKQYSSNPKFDPIIDEIIENCPVVQTMTLRGEPRPTYLGDLGFIILNSSSGRAFKTKF